MSVIEQKHICYLIWYYGKNGFEGVFSFIVILNDKYPYYMNTHDERSTSPTCSCGCAVTDILLYFLHNSDIIDTFVVNQIVKSSLLRTVVIILLRGRQRPARSPRVTIGVCRVHYYYYIVMFILRFYVINQFQCL